MGIKTIRIPLTEDEYQQVVNLKGKKSWRDFLFDLINSYEEKEKMIPTEVFLEILEKQIEASLETAKRVRDERPELYSLLLLVQYLLGEEVKEKELRDALARSIITVLDILEKIHPQSIGEMKWLKQGLSFLARGRREIYKISIDNFIKEFQRNSEIP
jgi:Trp operon repressor